MKNILISAALSLGLATGAMAAGGGEQHIEDFDFSFEGPFGTFDRDQLQRGLQVYTDVCSACHGLQYLYYRNIADEGGPAYTMEQARAYAARYEVYDAEIDDFRTATPADRFPVSNDPNAPDLTLMAKARAGFHGPMGLGFNQIFKGMGGAEYIASIMTGYAEAPSCAPADFDGHYNTAFAPGGYPDECLDEHGERMYPGSWISMAPPLFDDAVEYADGHSADVHHMAEDVSAFLMWTAEPKMMARQRAGFIGVGILALLSVLLYLTNKKIWAPIKGKRTEDEA